MKRLLFFLLLVSSLTVHSQQSYSTEKGIPYYPDSIYKKDVYMSSQCTLDIYYSKGLKNYATIIWFHGGGLTGGNKEIPKALITEVCLNQLSRYY